MKSGWQSKTLGDVCRFIDYRGKTPKKTERGLRLITAKNVKMGYLQETPQEFVSPECYDSWMTRGIPRRGDILFTTEAPLANVAQLDTDEKVVFAQRIIVLQPSVNNLDRTFLKYLLLSDLAQNRIHEKGTGATVKGIKASLLKAIPIEFPSLPEQQRIVGILDKAFDGISTAKANAEKNLQNARALFESYHYSVFSQPRNGWIEKKLGDVCEYINGKAHEQYIDKDGRFIVINSRFISSEGEIFKRSNQALLLLQPNDIAMVLSDVPNGKAFAKCFLVEEENKYTLNQRICAIRSTQFHTKFLFYQLNRNHHFLAFDNGENQTNMRLNQVLSCPLFIPPISEQKAIAAELDIVSKQTQHLESIYQQKLTALDALKKSLLHQAFNGGL